MRNLIIAVVVIAILAILAFVLVNSNNDRQNSETTDSTTENQTDESQEGSTSETTVPGTTNEMVNEVTFNYTSTGFSPSAATVKSGGKIIWVNNSSDQLQVGVDPHPAHTGDRGITGGEFVLTLGPGETKNVTVNKTGTFKFHNHLVPLDKAEVMFK